MGIVIEYNPELTLRDFVEYKNGNRKKEECVPENITIGKTYEFLKKDQRCYWMHGEIPLSKTKGGGNVSRPIGGVQLLEATHFLDGDTVYTKGKYKVLRLFDDDKVHFECTDPVGFRKW